MKRLTLLFITPLWAMPLAGQAPNMLWTRTYGGSDNDWGYSVQQTSDGGFTVAGSTESFGAGAEDVWLIHTDATGDTLWTRTYGGSDYDFGKSGQPTSDGGFIVTGYNRSFSGGECDLWLIRTDAKGDTLWTRTYGGSGGEAGWSVQQTSDGGFIVAGYTSSYGAGGDDVRLIRTDSLGGTLWARTYGGIAGDVGYSVQQISDSGFIVAGETQSFGAGGGDVWLIRTDATGDTLWTQTYGGSDYDGGYSVQQTYDDGFIVAGMTQSFGTGSADVWLIKTDSLGNTAPLAVTHPRHGQSERFTLHPAYPNPFNPMTTIHYELPVQAELTLTIYDILGREVARLVDSMQPTGYHQALWNGQDHAGREVPTGIYIARVVTPAYTKSNKMVLLK